MSLIEATTQTVAGHVYILLDNDDLNVAEGVTITSTATDAVTTWQGTHVFTVAGTIIGNDEAINTIGCIEAQTVSILASGVLISGGNGEIENADGVILDGVNSTLDNAGSITAWGSGVAVFVRDGGTTVITNSGQIDARLNGIWAEYGTGILDFTNTGLVTGDLHAYLGGDGIDRVTNQGSLTGDVALAGGDDLFDGRGGMVLGSILGGDGNDTFRPGAGAETFDGGAGTDVLDLSAETEALAVYLGNPALNAGAATAGDTHAGIEDILGGEGADLLVGNYLANSLAGKSGSDRLYGGNGNDLLDGGAKRDRLAGGMGEDTFVLSAYGDRGDWISDWDDATDTLAMEGQAFGYGQYKGGVDEAAFVSAADNLALDAGDRFIFRTTDATLWFDRDGTGTIAPTLVFDLQDGASLTHWSLLIA